jgi:hypothetical protein
MRRPREILTSRLANRTDAIAAKPKWSDARFRAAVGRRAGIKHAYPGFLIL